MMRGEEVWGARWKNCANPLSHRFMEIATKKQSLVVLAADLKTIRSLVNLIELVGPYISALKTHVDMIEDFDIKEWGKVVNCAKMHDLLLFEDRKFADIGKITQIQMGGIYDIRSWADLVTAHRISGPSMNILIKLMSIVALVIAPHINIKSYEPPVNLDRLVEKNKKEGFLKTTTSEDGFFSYLN